jgi:hypothetical protein
MSKNKAPLPFGEEDEATRAAVLARLFHRMSVTLDLMMTEFETSKDVSPKPILSKIIELQSVHFAVLKAQEAFLEKFHSNEDTPENDREKIRSDIGGKLDRIRDAIAAENVSEKS